MLVVPIRRFGQSIVENVRGFGAFTLFCLKALGWTMRGAGGFSRFALLWPQLFNIGTRSIPVVGLVGAFVGAVLGVEMYEQFAAIGQETRMGGVINISVVKQVGPVLAAVMIAGRVGGAVTAELGTMRVTEQIDALRVMGSDPIAHLVVPRVLACVIMVPILTVYSNLMGIFGGHMVVVGAYRVDAYDYWQFSSQFVSSWDVFTGLYKAVIFGLAIGLISCFKGFTCSAGAAGVGRAATDSFVTSFIVIIVINFFLAKLFMDLYTMIWGTSSITAIG